MNINITPTNIRFGDKYITRFISVIDNKVYAYNSFYNSEEVVMYDGFELETLLKFSLTRTKYGREVKKVVENLMKTSFVENNNHHFSKKGVNYPLRFVESLMLLNQKSYIDVIAENIKEYKGKLLSHINNTVSNNFTEYLTFFGILNFYNQNKNNDEFVIKVNNEIKRRIASNDDESNISDDVYNYTALNYYSEIPELIIKEIVRIHGQEKSMKYFTATVNSWCHYIDVINPIISPNFRNNVYMLFRNKKRHGDHYIELLSYIAEEYDLIEEMRIEIIRAFDIKGKLVKFLKL